MTQPPAVLETRSLTTLTPLYGEDVLYSLDGLESALILGGGCIWIAILAMKGRMSSFFDSYMLPLAILISLNDYPSPQQRTCINAGLGGKDPATVGSALPNLLPSSRAAQASGQVSLLTYLRDLYPRDWQHFKERVVRIAKASTAGSAAAAAPVGQGVKSVLLHHRRSLTPHSLSPAKTLSSSP